MWQGSSEVGPIVRGLARAALSGQPVTVVTTLDRALAAVTRARGPVVLIVDCFEGEPADQERCAALIARMRAPISILHPDEGAVKDLERIAGRPLGWFLAHAPMLELVAQLRRFCADVAAREADGTADAADRADRADRLDVGVPGQRRER